ncbi:MAG: hypothetical protein HY289_04140 [Planctomycetes bacterium]|nr:hypothetical protein [Planctomycetota bacterium]
MSKTLNLCDILLTTGRHLVLMGRFTEALAPLTKLCGFRSLPEYVAEEVQSLLAEIHLQHKKFKEARRHLTAAMAIRPLKAEYCYLMGIAIDEDETADRNRAEMYYSRAVEMEPSDTTYLLDFAAYLFTMDRSQDAMKLVRKAYKFGIADAEVIDRVADLLRREGHVQEATAKVRAALFHNHGAAPFRALWQRHQFALIHASQQMPTADAEPTFLPFVAAETHGKYLELGAKTFRIDQAEPLGEPTKKTPAPFRRPPKKG